jgi:hypothetical protein
MKTVTLFAVLAFAFALLGTSPVFAEDCDDTIAQMSAKTMAMIVQGKACLRQTDPMSPECQRSKEVMDDLLNSGLPDRAGHCARTGQVSLSAALIAQDLNDELLTVIDALTLKFKVALIGLQK